MIALSRKFLVLFTLLTLLGACSPMAMETPAEATQPELTSISTLPAETTTAVAPTDGSETLTSEPATGTLPAPADTVTFTAEPPTMTFTPTITMTATAVLIDGQQLYYKIVGNGTGNECHVGTPNGDPSGWTIYTVGACGDLPVKFVGDVKPDASSNTTTQVTVNGKPVFFKLVGPNNSVCHLGYSSGGGWSPYFGTECVGKDIKWIGNTGMVFADATATSTPIPPTAMPGSGTTPTAVSGATTVPTAITIATAIPTSLPVATEEQKPVCHGSRVVYPTESEYKGHKGHGDPDATKSGSGWTCP